MAGASLFLPFLPLLAKQIELVVDGGACSLEPTTVIDLVGDEPVLVRQGRGDAALFGL
jgi:tRNA A37 threonylcarbamoyladenosine synthetase subunit TsaC/SUA5/YrdC